ncbi:MAG: hypothetical protein CL868_12230 [Cytophagaceae bacterium]|nr:hypothetical protein [Cytophagaceae bacterium]|tara:strand:+ start:1305 stop:1502 length:198 start_codon:yes stop_codon:yes gene_type:complete
MVTVFFPLSLQDQGIEKTTFQFQNLSVSEKYGYETKLKQAKEVQSIGFIFWFIIILMVAILASAK